MECAMITIHHIHNFGSVFQAYGLQKFLRKHGYQIRVIDYRPAYFETGRNKIKTLAGKLLNIKPYLARKRKFDTFIRNNLSLTEKQYRTLRELEKDFASREQVYISGGDQLWNDYHPCGSDDAYKLTFAGNKRKIAYGTSMGRDNYTEQELKTLASKVEGYQSIMLREKCTVDLLAKHTEVPIFHVIDPVGLLDAGDFQKMAKKPALTEPYAVMYLADSSPLLDEAIQWLSQKLGMKIVHICGFRKKCPCDYFIKDAGPEEILGYIANADFVLSASFHATMFSLMFNKPFATLLPGEKTNARIEDVLKLVGLENRILRSVSELRVLEETIDYSKANEIMNELQATSRAMLLQALEDQPKG